MAKHELDEATVGNQVFFERWSRTWWKYDNYFHQYFPVGKSKLPLMEGQHPYHWNWYDFYEDMPVNSVVAYGQGTSHFVRKVSMDWEWI